MLYHHVLLVIYVLNKKITRDITLITLLNEPINFLWQEAIKNRHSV